jgi:hypothetical protein
MATSRRTPHRPGPGLRPAGSGPPVANTGIKCPLRDRDVKATCFITVVNTQIGNKPLLAKGTSRAIKDCLDLGWQLQFVQRLTDHPANNGGASQTETEPP